ncbi:hypothetical protein P171DRAFT_385057 [Karstenula rhodostoma CBS 690.94]|uniref:Uncharacterized protein n=1 Tax=Karstenula rhodostoma CBS 690.94 TaxID=1392251 RepID=A0A9P4PNY8_9PLEO|nr:hypothetical protein P171DRAFT_385057 [Karstenula rhodostoma CBS 690.94]
MLNRAATFSEGAQPPPAPRRRGSILSQYSDTRHSFRSSTDDLLLSLGKNDMEKLTTTDEVSLWHSAPLAFAIVPAFAGLLFQNGGAIVTDILLLGFGTLFLNWCVRTPWEWYHAAQHTQYVDSDEPERDDIILEEDELTGEPINDGVQASGPADAALQDDKDDTNHSHAPPSKAQEEARQELRNNEMLALLTCFIGPLVGAYLLHAIRSQLTRPAEGLVSNYNLTIFVMGAELRPIHHVIKMKQARMLHLQRVVRSDKKLEYSRADIEDISTRLASLEARATESPQNTDIESLKIGATVRQGIQPQLDALNRAVRRYEKRQAAQSMQMEARFQELDDRMRDALALAAAAARTGQRPGVITMLFTWVANLFTLGVQTSWVVATYPYRTTVAVASQISTFVTGADRQPRKRAKGQPNGNPYAPVSTSRVQSRSGR